MAQRPDQIDPIDPARPDGTADSSSGRSPDETGVEADGPLNVENPQQQSADDQRVAVLLRHTIDVPVLAEAVERQEAADAADTLETLDEEEAADVLEQMDEQSAADALAEMRAPLAASVLDDLLDEDKQQYAAELVMRMAPDDGADVLQTLDIARRERLLTSMGHVPRATLRRLLSYDEESAGGMMTTEFVALAADMTVGEATESVRKRQLPDGIQHLLVVDDQQKLVGVLSLRALLINDADTAVCDVMSTDVRAVRVDMDREQVASVFDRYDFYMLAVVDDDDHLLGVVTVDDVIDIIRAEQTEDVQKTVGAGGGEAVYSPVSVKVRGRFLWLSASLVMTCGAALVVLLFEELIRQHTILAFLLPVIAALVGNAGHQALAVTLRGIVLDEVRPGRVGPLILREMTAGVINGIMLGVLICVAVWGLSSFAESASLKVGMIAGIATLSAMGVGTFAGSGIPLLMRRVGVDPAQSSAIFLIMITDGVAFSVLLSLAFILL